MNVYVRKEEKCKNMKVLRNIYGKKLLSISIFLLITLNILGGLDVNLTNVSAVDSPYIAVVPQNTVDSTLRPGMNFTVSIYTNCTNWDITSYQFNLSYNPDVLQGVEVVNGDLIVGGSAQFQSGKFNDTSGELSLTVGFYFAEGEVHAGPGTLANVTFTVAGKGISNITIGDRTKLIGWNFFDEEPYDIIDAATMPSHIQHGYFDNRFSHDVAVNTVTVPPKANNRSVVPVGVEIVNLGSSNEMANVTVYYDSTYLDSQNVTLLVGENKTVSFNWKTATILLVAHDVAVNTVTVPAEATIGSVVPVGVEIVNLGSSNEMANVTVYYDSTYLDSQNVTLLVGENKTVSFTWVEAGQPAVFWVLTRNFGLYNETFEVKVAISNDTALVEVQTKNITLHGLAVEQTLFSWNTAGVAPDSYTVKVEAVLVGDDDLSNNQKTRLIRVIVPPIASFTFSPSEPIVNGTVTFNASASYDPDPNGEIDKYTWNFGDGNNATGVIATHNYTATGIYTVNLTVTDKDGLKDTFTTDVSVILRDIAITGVTPSADTAQIGETVSINVTVRNNGSKKETFNVTVHYDDDIIATQSVTELASGAAKSLTFSWDTSDVEAGMYTIKAVATILTGETNTADNTLTDGTVTIQTPPALDILPYAVAGGAAIIIIVAAAIYLLKIRKPT